MSKRKNIVAKSDMRATYPRNLTARRAEFRKIRNELVASDPLATIKRCRELIDGVSSKGNARGKPSAMGTWLPHFSLNALAAALVTAERALARRTATR